MAGERLDRLEQYRLAGIAAPGEEGGERGDQAVVDGPRSRDVGIIGRAAVERVEGAAQKSGRDRRTHIDPRIEKFGRDFRRALRDAIIMGSQPVDPAINFRRTFARKISHVALIAMRARHGFGYAPAGRAAAIGRMVSIAALAVNQFFDQHIDTHEFSLLDSGESNR